MIPNCKFLPMKHLNLKHFFLKQPKQFNLLYFVLVEKPIVSKINDTHWRGRSTVPVCVYVRLTPLWPEGKVCAGGISQRFTPISELVYECDIESEELYKLHKRLNYKRIRN